MKNLKFLFAIALFLGLGMNQATAQTDAKKKAKKTPVPRTQIVTDEGGEVQTKVVKTPKTTTKTAVKTKSAQSPAKKVEKKTRTFSKDSNSKVKSAGTAPANSRLDVKNKVYDNQERIKRTEEYIVRAKSQLAGDIKQGKLTEKEILEKEAAIEEAEKSVKALKKSVDTGKEQMREHK